MGVVDRSERLEAWTGEGGLIVATSALGTGVDFPGIVFILHIGMPWSMMDYAQEWTEWTSGGACRRSSGCGRRRGRGDNAEEERGYRRAGHGAVFD